MPKNAFFDAGEITTEDHYIETMIIPHPLNRSWKYCPSCYKPWRKSKDVCPNCKVILLKDKQYKPRGRSFHARD